MTLMYVRGTQFLCFLYKKPDQRFMSTQSAAQSLGPQPTNIALVQSLESQSLLSEYKSLHKSNVRSNQNDDVNGAKAIDPTGKVCLFVQI